MTVAVQLIRSGQAAALAEVVAGLYRVAFAPPPNSEGPADFAEQERRYARWARHPGFLLALAHAGEQPVGFVYGATLGRAAGLDPGPVFALVDLGVAPGRRRAGIGRRLHDAALAGSGARCAVLAVRRDLAANQAMYQRWGWRANGHGPDGTVRYLLELPAAAGT